MKKILLLANLIISLTFCNADIFSSNSKPTPENTIKYPTAAALLKATRSGEVPELIKDFSESRNVESVGRSIIAILQNDYHVSTSKLRFDTAGKCGLLLSNITKYELGGEQDKRIADAFQHNLKSLADGLNNREFMDGLDALTKDYARVLRESIALKKDEDERKQVAAAEKQHQADLEEKIAERKKQEEIRQRKAITDAEESSRNAAEQIRVDAERSALEKQAEIRKKKLDETLASPRYQLWTAAKKIETGLKMIHDAQQVLDHEDAVQQASGGIVDMTARRAAGERKVAGQDLVDDAFATYRKLGGIAKTPEEVEAGSDPAKEYR
jgi:hypothetical protein